MSFGLLNMASVPGNLLLYAERLSAIDFTHSFLNGGIVIPSPPVDKQINLNTSMDTVN